MPNETWQSDFTHYRLTDPDGASRHGHRDHHLARRPLPLRPARLRTPTGSPPRSCSTTFRRPLTSTDPRLHLDRQRHGLHRPTRRQAARRPQRLRARAPRLGHRPEELPTQPPHHLRQSRALPADPQELAARPTRPADHIAELQTLLDRFVDEYNHHRPHRSLPHRATPATAYTRTPKAIPRAGDRSTDTHDRVRHDRVDKPATSPCASPANSATSASAEPTPEPASSCSSRTSTSASSTPPPANSSASSSSTPARDYQPTEPTPK